MFQSHHGVQHEATLENAGSIGVSETWTAREPESTRHFQHLMAKQTITLNEQMIKPLRKSTKTAAKHFVLRSTIPRDLVRWVVIPANAEVSPRESNLHSRKHSNATKHGPSTDSSDRSRPRFARPRPRNNLKSKASTTSRSATRTTDQ